MEPSPTDQLAGINQIAIIGTGLLGASIGLGLKAAGFAGRIVGMGRSEATLTKAMATGGFDDAVSDYARAIPGSRLVVVCVPLGTFAQVFGQIAPHDHDELVITDAGSTKASVIAAARDQLPHPERFVPAHPMAGSERQGPDSGDAGLFRGKPCIICGDEQTVPSARALVESMWEALGMVLLPMSAAEHDAKAATVSHLPHLASVALVATAEQRGGWEVASTGFRDVTRLASSNPPMRADIMLTNREPITRAIDAMIENLTAARQLLHNTDDPKVIETYLTARQAARDQWLSRREAEDVTNAQS